MNKELLVPFLSAIVAALIAGLVALVSSILSKDQKTSEFRQAWIDSLRSDIAEFVGVLDSKITIAKLKDREVPGSGRLEFFDKPEDTLRVGACLMRIRLRLNRKEHKDMLKILELFQHGKEPRSYEELIAELEMFTLKSQDLLKGEWKRVKRGEWSFRFLKIGSAVAVILSAYACYLIYVGSWPAGIFV